MPTEYIAACREVVLHTTVQRQTLVIFRAGPRGLPGTPVELRTEGAMIQWRLVGDAEWIDLAPIASGNANFKKLYEATGAEAGVIPNSVCPGISAAVFSEIQQSSRWLDEYTTVGTVPEHHYRIEADDSITLGTPPEFGDPIYIKWTL